MSAPASQRYDGGCHCGRVRFRVTTALERIVECNCSICTKKGILHIVVPQAAFELLSGAEALATYTFGTGVAKHHFCRVCGICAFYVPRSAPEKIDVNVRCLDGVDLAALPVDKFDGRRFEQAIAEGRPDVT